VDWREAVQSVPIPHNVRDALALTTVIRECPERPRKLVWMHYANLRRPEVICRRVAIPFRAFPQALNDARRVVRNRAARYGLA
jgi:hypothetical protein